MRIILLMMIIIFIMRLGYARDLFPQDIEDPIKNMSFVADPDKYLYEYQKTKLNENIKKIERLHVNVLIFARIPGKFNFQNNKYVEYAEEVFSRWEIGNTQLQDGILITLCVSDKQLTLIRGSEAKHIINDENYKIIQSKIDKDLRKRRYSSSLYHTVDYIHRLSKGEDIKAYTLSEKFGLIFTVSFIIFWIYLRHRQSQLHSKLKILQNDQKQINNNFETFIVNNCSLCLKEFQTQSLQNDNSLAQQLNPQTTLDCTHSFHRECLKNWQKKNQSCPLCPESNEPLEMQNIIQQRTYLLDRLIKIQFKLHDESINKYHIVLDPENSTFTYTRLKT